MPEPLSWEDAYALKEEEACLICARSMDRFAARIEDIARDYDLPCACQTVLPVLPGRRIIGPIEAKFLARFGRYTGDTETLLHFPATTTEAVE